MGAWFTILFTEPPTMPVRKCDVEHGGSTYQVSLELILPVECAAMKHCNEAHGLIMCTRFATFTFIYNIVTQENLWLVIKKLCAVCVTYQLQVCVRYLIFLSLKNYRNYDWPNL